MIEEQQVERLQDGAEAVDEMDERVHQRTPRSAISVRVSSLNGTLAVRQRDVDDALEDDEEDQAPMSEMQRSQHGACSRPRA